MPKMSLVMPVYNVEAYIKRCLISCINQTVFNIEIIIVDDCGSDSSIKIVETFASYDSRIKIIKNEKNLGTYHARRVGTEHSNSPYVLFIDPDDELELYTVEHLLSQLQIDSKPDLVFFGSRKVPQKKWWQKETIVPNIPASNNKLKVIKNIFSCKQLSLGIEGKLVSKTTLLQAFNTLNICTNERLIFGEDVLLLFGILINSSHIKSTKRILYIYHQNLSSVTLQTDLDKLIYNRDNLDIIIKKISDVNNVNQVDIYIKTQILKRLAYDYSVLNTQIEQNFIKNINNYFKILVINKKPRYAIKLLLLFITLGKKKL